MISAQSRRWKWIAFGFALSLAALIVSNGADRTAADPSTPIALHGPTTPIPSEQRTFRIASFNIHSGKGGDNQLDLARTAAALNEPFDIAGLYEVRATPWSSHADQAADLADRLHLASAFAPAERQWWHDHFGNAVLSRWPVNNIVRIPLPNTRGKAYRNAVLIEVGAAIRAAPVSGTLPSVQDTFSSREKEEGAARITAPTVKILLTHIDRADDREQQLALVIKLFLALEPPAILMGDLNTTASDPQLAELLDHPGVHSALHDGLPDGPPPETIDWLFHRGLRTVSAQLVESGASDHPIVSVELEVPGRRTAAQER